MRHRFFAQFRIFASMLALTGPLSCSGAADWEHAQIADAMRAAPPIVTHTAKIYAWQPYGELVLVRDGPGPYTCVASGSASLRFAKPPLSFPDPFCADPYAWDFIQAYWTEEDPDPTEAIRPLPRAPGLVWMLAARQDVTSHVALGKDEPTVVQTTLMGAAQGAGPMAADTISLTSTAHDPTAAPRPGGLQVDRDLRSDASTDPMDEGERHDDWLYACPGARGRPPGADGPRARPRALYTIAVEVVNQALNEAAHR